LAHTSSKDLRKQGRKFAREVSSLLRNRGGRLAEAQRAKIQESLAEVDRALGKDDPVALAMAIESLRGELARHEPVLRKASVREYVQSLVLAVGVALLIRAFVFEAFKIPSSSMVPTLLVQDHIFVNKFIYGLRMPFSTWRFVETRDPVHGEVVVFSYPGPGEDNGKDFIKRVVAVAGDRVRLEGNVLHLNGRAVPTEVLASDIPCDDATLGGCRCVRQRERAGDIEYETQHLAGPHVQSNRACENRPNWPTEDPREFASRGANPEFPDVLVPEGHILMMGDNRDNSSDGRFWGFVPVQNTKGKALVLWWPPNRWFQAVR
jgi:signal peptidase I